MSMTGIGQEFTLDTYDQARRDHLRRVEAQVQALAFPEAPLHWRDAQGYLCFSGRWGCFQAQLPGKRLLSWEALGEYLRKHGYNLSLDPPTDHTNSWPAFINYNRAFASSDPDPVVAGWKAACVEADLRKRSQG